MAVQLHIPGDLGVAHLLKVAKTLCKARARSMAEARSMLGLLELTDGMNLAEGLRMAKLLGLADELGVVDKLGLAEDLTMVDLLRRSVELSTTVLSATVLSAAALSVTAAAAVAGARWVETHLLAVRDGPLMLQESERGGRRGGGLTLTRLFTAGNSRSRPISVGEISLSMQYQKSLGRHGAHWLITPELRNLSTRRSVPCSCAKQISATFSELWTFQRRP
jgi:hypothetical protein